MSYINRMEEHLAIGAIPDGRRPGCSEAASPAVPYYGALSAVAELPIKMLEDLKSPEIDSSIKELNDILSRANRQLNISIDPSTGAAVFRVIDAESGSVVLQIPATSTSEIGRALILRRGILVDTK